MSTQRAKTQEKLKEVLTSLGDSSIDQSKRSEYAQSFMTLSLEEMPARLEHYKKQISAAASTKLTLPMHVEQQNLDYDESYGPRKTARLYASILKRALEGKTELWEPTATAVQATTGSDEYWAELLRAAVSEALGNAS